MRLFCTILCDDETKDKILIFSFKPNSFLEYLEDNEYLIKLLAKKKLLVQIKTENNEEQPWKLVIPFKEWLCGRRMLPKNEYSVLDGARLVRDITINYIYCFRQCLVGES
jgi:hypothetical protein